MTTDPRQPFANLRRKLEADPAHAAGMAAAKRELDEQIARYENDPEYRAQFDREIEADHDGEDDSTR